MLRKWNKLATLASLAAASPFSIIQPRLHSSQQVQVALSDCLSEASFTVLTRNDTGYTTAILPYNLRLPWKPIAIVIPETPDHIAAALKCANRAGVKVAARGGGHSYGAQGIGGQDGSLVIDMNRFNAIEVDDETGIASVGSGVRLGNLAKSLFDTGGRALPHGICPGVGIGGHALHGGFGYTSRMWGTTLDSIVMLDVVLANGTITKASEKQNPELFWALRGAGSSFGVVTTFHAQTKLAPKTAFQYSISIPVNQTNTITARVETFLRLQQYGMKAPKEISLRVLFALTSLSISGVYWGTQPDFMVAIQPLLNTLPGATARGNALDWITALQKFANGQPLNQPLTGYNVHETLHTKSLVTTAIDPLTSAQLTPFFEFLSTEGRNATVSIKVIADLYGGGDSEIARRPRKSTSYAHRDSLFTFEFHTNTMNQKPPYPESGFAFLNKLVSSITDNIEQSNLKGYANYNDPTLSAAEAHQQYYGNEPWDGMEGSEGVYDKLVRIKKAVDPDMLIWNPQAIGVE